MMFLKGQDNLPWLCVGDFNKVTSPSEQIGGNPRSESQMTAFRDCLSDCELNDLGFKGYIYTWNNKREGLDNIQVWLDRGTATAPAGAKLTCSRQSLCVVNNQPVGNPKRKV
jgi:hypothetical protein